MIAITPPSGNITLTTPLPTITVVELVPVVVSAAAGVMSLAMPLPSVTVIENEPVAIGAVPGMIHIAMPLPSLLTVRETVDIGGMKFYLNEVDLSTLGVVAAQAKPKGSNIALSGQLDFPKRLQKTAHAWGDQNGVEPYVSAPEIMHGGRNIDFHFLMEAADTNAAYLALFGLYDLIDSLTDLAVLSCDFGSWSVLVRDEIQIEDLGNGALAGVIPFREPVCDLSGTIPTEEDPDVLEGIDGVSWSSLGFALVDFRQLGITRASLEGMLNRPKPKGGESNSYVTEGYQVTKTEARKYKLIGAIEAVDYAGLKTIISGLYALFTAAGTRVLYLTSDLIRVVFCEEGFEIDQIVVDYKATARITIHFTEASESDIAENWLFLGDTVENYVTSTVGDKILIRI